MTRCGTVSGRAIDLLAPDWGDIDLGDVAHGLALVNRFCGQSAAPIPVTLHSLVVADLAPPALRLPALLHDAHEALFGDWPRPAVEAVGRRLRGLDEAIGLVKFRLDVAIARRALEEARAVAEISLADEAEALAREMRFGPVRDADAEALGLEDAFRRRGAFGPEADASLARYAGPGDAQAWLAAVRAATKARYGAAR